MSSYKDAKAALHRAMDHLERLNPSAARSLAEGLEGTLTLHRLAVPDALRRSLKSTNIIESSLSRVDEVTRRVKRWRDGDHLQRWTANARLVAEKKFRKVKRTSVDGGFDRFHECNGYSKNGVTCTVRVAFYLRGISTVSGTTSQSENAHNSLRRQLCNLLKPYQLFLLLALLIA
jgi:hypothetical protein